MQITERKLPAIRIIQTIAPILFLIAISVNPHSASAQPDFGIREGFGISMTQVALATLVILLLYGLIIVCVKEQTSRIVMGGTVGFLGILIIAMITPVYMSSYHAGATHPYCQDNPCDDSGDKSVFTIAGYPQLAQYPTLNKAVLAARSHGPDNCCAYTTINYFDELSAYPVLQSTIKLNGTYSYDNAYLIKSHGEYYTIAFHHMDVDYNYTYYGTTFTLDAAYLMVLIPILGYFSIIMTSIEHKRAKTIPANTQENKLLSKGIPYMIVRWLANRRLIIPAIGIAVIFISFFAYLLSRLDYHSSTALIAMQIVIALVIYILIIVASRTIVGRKLKLFNAE